MLVFIDLFTLILKGLVLINFVNLVDLLCSTCMLEPVLRFNFLLINKRNIILICLDACCKIQGICTCRPCDYAMSNRL